MKTKTVLNPFIFTWISFNGWASCITELDKDREWLDALLISQEINSDFAKMVADGSAPVQKYAPVFRELWPIFKSQEIRRKGMYQRHDGDRQTVIQSYLVAGLTEYQPNCWKRHKDEGSPVPVDWPHTLEALYRVRCNLFHGEKAPHSEMDRLIVSSAFRVLIYFLHDTGYVDA